MAINADKPQRWKADIAASVDQFNAWFMETAPKAFRETRIKTTAGVLEALGFTKDHTDLRPDTLKTYPSVLPTLRMSTCPSLAVDRLVGLSGVAKNLVLSMDRDGKIPPRMRAPALERDLQRICSVISRLLDPDLFPWIHEKRKATQAERARAGTVVADRLCGALANPIVRNAQEKRQLAVMGQFLSKRGYKHQPLTSGRPLTEMTPGTFAFRAGVLVGETRKVNIPIDIVIQPKRPRRDGFPLLIEAKSAGDFTNTNKRRKEEATKNRQLKDIYGPKAKLLLLLCGYFDSGYLGYEAAEGIDWFWEHRLSDIDELGI